MIDDRVTRGTEEAHRLLLLHGNADLRLTKPGYEIGWIPRGCIAGLSPKNRRSSGRWHGEKDEGETGSGGSAGPAGVRIQRMKQRRRSGPVDRPRRGAGRSDRRRLAQTATGAPRPRKTRGCPPCPFSKEGAGFRDLPFFSGGMRGGGLFPCWRLDRHR